MDRVLVVSEEEGLPSLFRRLGYEVVADSSATPNVVSVNDQIFDIVVISGRMDAQQRDIIEYLRANEPSTRVPIICLTDDSGLGSWVEAKGFEKIERLSGKTSPGLVAAKAATLLRLRKFDGADSFRASVDEINATLRDVNERLLKEREEARKIQQALLPGKLPAGASYQVAAYYAPLEECGGDWYFAKSISATTVAAQIADATGHGLAAALLSSMTKLAMAAAWNDSPDLLLEGMNRLMAPHMPEGRFVTMCAVNFDSATGELKVASAGHPPALIMRGDLGTFECLKSDGFAIGFLEEAKYKIATAKLEPGDSVTLYTDGICEAQNRDSEMFGTERIGAALLRAAHGSSSGGLIKTLYEEFEKFTDGRMVNDDITIITIKRL